MKVLFVGDVHNHSYIFDDVERLDKEYNFDRIIFLGDYVDDWNTTNKESSKTLLKVIELKESNPNKYTFCLGNHELSYLGYPCSGHRFENDSIIEHLLKEDINLFNMYTTIQLGDTKYYCSHAGFLNSYLETIFPDIDDTKDYDKVLEKLNENILQNLDKASLCSYLRGGSHNCSSFLWADKREFIYECNYGQEELMFYNQIIGHTPVPNIDLDNNLIFIDTHSTYRDERPYGDKSYLAFIKNKFEILY